MSKIRLLLLFFMFMHVLSSSIYSTLKIFAPQQYSAVSLQYFLHKFPLTLFVDHCNDIPIDELKDLIKQTASEHVQNNKVMDLLKELEEEIQNKINKIEFQIQHKWKFDHDAAKISLIASLATFVFYKLTDYTYKYRKRAHDLAWDRYFHQDLWGKEITVRTEESHFFKKTTFETNQFLGFRQYSGNYDDFVKDCKEYLAAEEAYEATKGLSSFTVLFGVITGISLSIAAITLWATLVDDPNYHNEHLPMYKDLLAFVIQLKIEYTVHPEKF